MQGKFGVVLEAGDVNSMMGQVKGEILFISGLGLRGRR